MRTMIPLRLLGIASNVAFITYGYVEGLEPVLILHAILLPLNIYRLAEMIRLVREVEGAGRDPSSLAWLLPFMRPASLAAGAVLFRKGEPADVMYLLTEGRIRLEEFGVEIEARRDRRRNRRLHVGGRQDGDRGLHGRLPLAACGARARA